MKKDEPPKPASPPNDGPRRGLDPELQAMAKIDRLVAELDSAAQYRILEWLKGRYQSRHMKEADDSPRWESTRALKEQFPIQDGK